MIAIEEIATVQPNGNLVLHHPELKAGEQVKVIVLLDASRPKPQPSPVGRRLKQDWAGGLADLTPEYTSAQLQHKANATLASTFLPLTSRATAVQLAHGHDHEQDTVRRYDRKVKNETT